MTTETRPRMTFEDYLTYEDGTDNPLFWSWKLSALVKPSVTAATKQMRPVSGKEDSRILAD